MTCQLLCVAPDQAAEFWPHVAHYIERACRRGLHDFAGAERSVKTGAALLWIAWDEPEILGAATTELHKINGRRLCFISAMGGKDRDKWIGLVSGIEDFARAEKCDAVVIMGRTGWTKALPRYHERGRIIELRL